MSIYKKLNSVQTELKAPKNQFNSFGKYKYRNQEDILEALKPLLAKHELSLTIHDELMQIENRVYIKAVATLFDFDGNSIRVCAQAREEESKKGMDASQVTGATSSYARKYALNGLFLIDDTRDADAGNNSDAPAKAAPKTTTKAAPAKAAPKARFDMDEAVSYMKAASNKNRAYSAIIKKHGANMSDKQKEGLAKFK